MAAWFAPYCYSSFDIFVDITCKYVVQKVIAVIDLNRTFCFHPNHPAPAARSYRYNLKGIDPQFRFSSELKAKLLSEVFERKLHGEIYLNSIYHSPFNFKSNGETNLLRLPRDRSTSLAASTVSTISASTFIHFCIH